MVYLVQLLLVKMESYEVAIIGGGISGLYCAKKLKDNGIEGIVIIEKLDRWGGRLNTDMIEIDGRMIKDEKGAMRFTYKDPDGEQTSNMPLLSRLIKDMEMESEMEPFYMEPQPAEDSLMTEVLNYNSNYFGSRHFTSRYAEKNPKIWKELYNLEDDEIKSPDQVIVDVYQKLLDHNADKVKRYFDSLGQGDKAQIILKQEDVQLLQQYQEANYWAFFRNEFEWPKGVQKNKLRDFNLFSLLKAMEYSKDCCQMMEKTLFDGKDSVSQGNAAVLLQFYIASDLLHDNLYHFRNGWSSLVKTIKSYLDEGTGNIELLKNCEVGGIQDVEYGFTLELFSGERKIKAKHVVMAIPPDAVKALMTRYKSDTSLLETYNSVISLCNSVVGVDSVKVILYFECDWWNTYEDIVLFGASSTDLPCGCVYPYYGRCRNNCQSCDNCKDGLGKSALTIYCGSNRADFWTSCQRLGQSFESPLQKENASLIPSSEHLVGEAMKQLKNIFNVKEIPYPILTSYRSWNSEDNLGYAYHYWRVGVDDQNLKSTQPVKGKNLYLCTEAWSGYQGYVEGSLMSTEKVVNRIISNKNSSK
ncbi:uncharacterized protein LOC134819613 [Bolinopsis microptera]|uniref:uncharacterized protein LOC134819613 n=1 Tax=Bolinopsis microptera TaxID=2820187 RepID=UPI00307AFE37